MAECLMLPVGMGDLQASRDPSTVLVAYGLGSCIGVCMYDPVVLIGGLAHVMLPSSREVQGWQTSSKFADCAIAQLIEKMTRLGSGPRRLQARIAGGARMLTAPGFGDSFNIGQRNIESVRSTLQLHGIPLLSADTGGTRGRTMAMHIGTGRITVRTIGEREIEL